MRAPIGPRLAFDLHSFRLRSRHSQIETRREALKETGTPRGADGAGRPATGAGGVLPLRAPVPGPAVLRLGGGGWAEAPALPAVTPLLLLPAPGTRVLVGDTPRERDPFPCRLQDIVAPLLGPPLSDATRCCSRQPSTVPKPCR